MITRGPETAWSLYTTHECVKRFSGATYLIENKRVKCEAMELRPMYDPKGM
jgi:hypothetical protein